MADDRSALDLERVHRRTNVRSKRERIVAVGRSLRLAVPAPRQCDDVVAVSQAGCEVPKEMRGIALPMQQDHRWAGSPEIEIVEPDTIRGDEALARLRHGRGTKSEQHSEHNERLH